jgi:membrane protease YdiL (CAAX protease family)
MPDRVPWLQVGVFAAATLASMWLVFAPFHLGWLEVGGGAWIVSLVGVMFTPALVAGACVLAWDRRPGVARRLGLLAPDWRRLLVFLAIGLVAPIAASLGAVGVGAAIGWYEPDLAFSGYRALLRAQIEATGGDPEPMLAIFTPAVIVGTMALNVVLGSFINVVFALGEELGWRGWLLPRLMPLGAWPAMILSGALWGLWHAPVILLGYNYPSAPVAGVALFVGFCVVWGVLHGWTRVASGSVWPAALMHGAVNASAGLSVLFAKEGATPDNVWVGLVGVSGWILPVVAIVALAALGALPGRWREARWAVSDPS